MIRFTVYVWLGCSLVGTAWGGSDDEAAFFEARIRPVLARHCYQCHSADAKKLGGDLLLDARDRVLRGGDSGPAVEPGDPEASLLLQAIRYDGLEMPPSGKLPDRVIADFEQWIRAGAYDPRDSEVARPAAAPAIDLETGRRFWSFQRPQLHPAPQVRQREWPRGKADYFVLARLERAGLAPSRRATRRTLIRRLSFDLTGLPPSPEEVNRFVRDDRPDAYPRLVERLLAAPQFGERWGRLWLDVARYAEDQAHIVGNNQSLFYPNAYLYRDWLIGALNSDLPFDRFAKLQLAADLIEPANSEQLASLGFLGLGPKYYRRNAPEVMADEWEDRVDTVTRGFLGLTVACARCHDHKYDPIPTDDYYALAGVFAGTEMFNRPVNAGADCNDDGEAKQPAEAMHVVREGKPQDLRVHIRGDAANQGEVVPRRFLRVLTADPVPLQDGSGRQQLADAIACEENPLTARVIVNRIWAQYFGRGLVSTPSNFGQLGDRPSHPKLIDDLAVRFMQSGWSLKWLHREIVLSATYRQATDALPRAMELDPANELLGRMSRRRMTIEMWRDAVLVASGELDRQIGGASLDIQDAAARRRTVYGRVSRLELDALLQLFDFPDPNVHAATRSETTTPLQKLFMLNSPFMVKRAEQLAARLDREAPPGDLATGIKRAYAWLYCREPTEQELLVATEFIGAGNDRLERWEQYAQALLAANEMLYLD